MEKIVELCLGIFEDKALCDKLSSISRVNTNLSEIERRYTTLNQQLGSALKELASQRETVASAESLSLQAQQKYQARIDQLENLVRELGDQISKTDQQAAAYLQQIMGQVQTQMPSSTASAKQVSSFNPRKNTSISEDLYDKIESRIVGGYPELGDIEYAQFFADDEQKGSDESAFNSGVENIREMIDSVRLTGTAQAALRKLAIQDEKLAPIRFMKQYERRVFGGIQTGIQEDSIAIVPSLELV